MEESNTICYWIIDAYYMCLSLLLFKGVEFLNVTMASSGDLPKPDIINPYSLLGVTTNSTPKELKKAYYELALICHPDRNGNKEDMEILHACYEFVKQELEQTNTQTTFGDLESQFQEFLSTQEKSVPEFRDIHDDTFDLAKFNQQFDSTRHQKDDNIFNFDGNGYGDEMEPSEYVDDVSIFQRVKSFFSGWRATNEPKVPPLSLENAVYNSSNIKPTKNTFHVQNWTDSAPTSDNKLSPHFDYSGKKSYTDQGMTDYKVAFTDQKPIPNWDVEPPEKSLDTLVETREKDESLIPYNIKWGHSGLRDSEGKKITNWKRIVQSQ